MQHYLLFKIQPSNKRKIWKL